MTEAELWSKIWKYGSAKWFRIENICNQGFPDTQAWKNNKNVLVELKVGMADAQMELRDSQVKFLLSLRGHADNVYILKYNYRLNLAKLSRVYGGSKNFETVEIPKITWKSLIEQLELELFK